MKMKKMMLVMLGALLCFGASHAEQSRPNVVFILADDLGWMDVAYHGSRFYETPNLDRLAKMGMQFSRAYAAAQVCAPTRGSIMSGKYPARSGFTGLTGQHGKPSKGKLVDADFTPGLPGSEVTLAECLQGHGYRTWHLGKWHLGEDGEYAPEQQGFDRYITGFEEGRWQGKRFRKGDNKFISDHLTDCALALIDEADNRPFFLNLWYYAVHTPIKAKPEDIAYFTEKAKKMGLDQVQAFEKGEHYPAAPWFDETRTSKRIRRRVIQSDPVYAAFVYCLDANVGRLMDGLEERGLMEDTVIVFFSDNGGLSSAEGSPTCNAPLREGKGWMYEGGMREPCSIVWKGRVEPGQLCDTPIVSTDFYPTILDLANLELMPEQHMDGVSLMPLLKGEKALSRKALFWHSPHYFNNGSHPFSAVLCDDWKYIYNYQTEQAELYDLQRDQEEQNNLISKEVERGKTMKAQLDQWLHEVKAKHPEQNSDERDTDD